MAILSQGAPNHHGDKIRLSFALRIGKASVARHGKRADGNIALYLSQFRIPRQITDQTAQFIIVKYR
jgi:hypothetical protein